MSELKSNLLDSVIEFGWNCVKKSSSTALNLAIPACFFYSGYLSDTAPKDSLRPSPRGNLEAQLVSNPPSFPSMTQQYFDGNEECGEGLKHRLRPAKVANSRYVNYIDYSGLENATRDCGMSAELEEAIGKVAQKYGVVFHLTSGSQVHRDDIPNGVNIDNYVYGPYNTHANGQAGDGYFTKNGVRVNRNNSLFYQIVEDLAANPVIKGIASGYMGSAKSGIMHIDTLDRGKAYNDVAIWNSFPQFRGAVERGENNRPFVVASR